MNCHRCNGRGTYKISWEPPEVEPCECAAGDQWRLPAENAMKYLMTAFEAERTPTT